MKIALLASTFLPRIGGAELTAHNLAIQFGKLGHEAVVFAWWGQGRAVRKVVPYRLQYLWPRSFTHGDGQRLAAGKRILNRVVPQLLWHQWRNRFDVWNIQHAYPFGLLAAPAFRRRGIPVVVTPQGDDVIYDPASQYDFLGQPGYKARMANCLSAAHRITATSPAMRAAINALGVAPERIVDIPNGVSRQRFLAAPNRRAETRQAWDLPPDVPLLLSVGRFHAQKGYDLIPPTLAELIRRSFACLWVIVGTDSDRVREGVPPDVAERIRCLPPILEPDLDRKGYDHLPSEGLIDLYHACDIFVLPSRNEPFGMVVAEALAAGLPVVGTTGMGAPDMIAPGKGGYVVEKENPLALADALALLLSQADLRRQMGEWNRQNSGRYDWSEVARQYLDCFETAIGEARRK